MTAGTLRSGAVRRGLRWLLPAALVAAWLAGAVWQAVKPLPAGTRVAGETATVPETSLRLLVDVTAADAFSMPVMTQQIAPGTLQLVAGARDFLVLDYFLFNGQGGPAGELDYATGLLRPVARELREALLARRRADPALPMLLLVDPINAYYGRVLPPELQELAAAGIDVVVTRLDGLRDPNPFYGAAWRGLLAWWLQPSEAGWLPNLLDHGGPPLSAGALGRLLAFKANHRKVIVTGDGAGGFRGIIGSANPHDASSAHSNVALYVEGAALAPLVASEYAIAGWSGWRGTVPAASRGSTEGRPAAGPAPAMPDGTPTARVAVVTEGAIHDALLARLAATVRGDAVDVAMFYLSDRHVVEALAAAAARGVEVRLLLDPNKDAFGFEKSGLPNRQVASELLAVSDGAVHIRWYRTHGEQFHAKLVAIRQGASFWFTLGSANLTRRNLEDYNLEANVVVECMADGMLARQVSRWFDDLWSNRGGNGTEYTAGVDLYADGRQGRYWLYRFMEASGFSTF